jgi:hypothetical protein
MVNTKWLMTASALFMGAVGIVMTFAPQEVSSCFSIQSTANLDALVFQILGALYFAFAMVNWTAKGNLIGGIYARPIAIGNLTHFVIGALALVKGYFAFHQTLILISALVYTAFAIGFTIVFFTHPVKGKD